MTDTNDDDDPELDVCVCCKAVAIVPPCLPWWESVVCQECLYDGTYLRWLVGPVEAGLIASGQPAADDTADPV